MAERRLDDLIASHCLDEATPAQQEELAVLLAESPAAVERFAREVVTHRLLADGGRRIDRTRLLAALPERPGNVAAAVMGRVRRRRSRATLAWAGAAAVLAVALAVLVRRAPRAPGPVAARAPHEASAPALPARAALPSIVSVDDGAVWADAAGVPNTGDGVPAGGRSRLRDAAPR